METSYGEILLDLENELSKMKDVSEDFSEQLEYAIGRCQIALVQLRKLVIKTGFSDQKSEIYFFKKIKPTVYCKLLYYRAVFDLESKRQKTETKVIRRYFKKKLFHINEYMEEHQIMAQYYKCGFIHLDEKFFVRNTSEIPLELRGSHHLMDEEFFTWHDHTFSTIIANEMLIDFITNELKKLETDDLKISTLPKSPLQWTGKKIELAENLYAWYFSGSVNHGKATIKDLVEFIGWALNIDLSKDIYRYFTGIQERKIDQTKFLDFLKAVLTQRLDEMNE